MQQWPKRIHCPLGKTEETGDVTTRNKYNNNKHNLIVFYKIWKKLNEVQLAKNKKD